MKKAKKIAIAVVGSAVAVGMGILGKYFYDLKNPPIRTGTDYGVQPIETKNSMLEQYEGKIKGTDLKQLIRRINAYNDSDIFPHDIVFEFDGKEFSEVEGNSTQMYANGSTLEIKNSSIYDVSFEYGKDAYINKVIIFSVKGTTASTETLNEESNENN